MVKRWKVMFPALDGPDERTAYIYLPESYTQDTDTRYPVLYMFDGHNVFFDTDATYGKCWGMKEYMDFTETQMIIAAVECSHDPNHGRLKEYSPYTFSDPALGKIPGLGKKTMEWLIHSFKTEIDSSYRTLPDREHTYIAGSSMGGLMSLYAVLEYNSVFSRAAALSPSIWAGRRRLEALAERARLLPGTAVYMDYGSEELSSHKDMLSCFENMAHQLLCRGIYVTSRIVPLGTHCEASWEKQLPFMMHTLTYEPGDSK